MRCKGPARAIDQRHGSISDLLCLSFCGPCRTPRPLSISIKRLWGRHGRRNMQQHLDTCFSVYLSFFGWGGGGGAGSTSPYGIGAGSQRLVRLTSSHFLASLAYSFVDLPSFLRVRVHSPFWGEGEGLRVHLPRGYIKGVRPGGYVKGVRPSSPGSLLSKGFHMYSRHARHTIPLFSSWSSNNTRGIG